MSSFYPLVASTHHMNLTLNDIALPADQLQQNQALLQTVFDASENAIMVCKCVRNSKGEIESFKIILNNQAAEISACNHSIVGWSLSEVFPQVRNDMGFDKLIEVVEQNRSQHFEISYLQNNAVKWCSINAVKLGDGVVITSTEITERKASEEKLKSSQRDLWTLINNTTDVITRWNNSKKLVFANAILETKTGMPNTDLYGKTNIEMGQPPSIALPYMHKLEEVLKIGRPADHFDFFKVFGSQSRYYHTRMIPEMDDEGHVQTVLCISRDMTELMEAQENIDKQQKQLVQSIESLQKKNDFISMASHELKTPISAIKTYLQLLLDSYEHTKDDFLLTSLTAVKNHTNKLAKLATELLDITKVDIGMLKFALKKFNLAGLVHDCVSLIQPSTKHQIVVDSDEILYVYADQERISQVFTNILTNAIKYSPDADTVHVRLTKTNKEVQVSVTDKGIGIDKRHFSKIFNRFYRVGQKGNTNISGFGIGLYIASEIVRKHNGRIWVDSEHSKGSTFYFTLPAA